MPVHALSWATWVGGCALLVLDVAAGVAVGVGLRRRLVPAWRGAAAACAAAGLGYAYLVLAWEIIGLAGIFDRAGLAVGPPLLAVAVLVLARRWPPPDVPREPEQERQGRTPARAAAAALLVASVVAPWFAGTRRNWDIGIYDVDSHYYHLAQAAFVAQTGSLRTIPLLSPGDGVDYYPLNAELAHAVGLAAFHSEVLSLLLNDLSLFLLLGCAWALCGLRGLAVAAVLADLPIMTRLEPGTAKNDMEVLAFLAVAVLALQRRSGSRDTGALVVAGVGLGLAAGTKLSALVAVALVTVVAVAAARSARLHTLVALVVPALVTGGFFYARALIATGSPVPSLQLPLLPRPPLPLVDALSASVLDAARSPDAWNATFHVGFLFGLGPWWPLPLAVTAVGCLLPLRRRAGPFARGLALAALVTLLISVVQPGNAPGLGGGHYLFATNLRLVTPGVLLALFALAADRGLPTWVVLAVSAVTIGSCLSDTDGAWQLISVVPSVAPGVVLTVLGAVAAVAYARVDRRIARAAVPVAAVGVLAGLAPLARDYVQQRYHPPASDSLALFGWSDSVHHARIAVVGYPQTYGYQGSDLTNTAVYLGQPEPHHGMVDITDCTVWRDSLRDGHFGWVVIRPFGTLPTPLAQAWTESLPGAVVVLKNSAGEVVHLTQPVTGSGCS